MGKGVYVASLCLCYLTWHDYPFLVEGESHGILLLSSCQILYNYNILLC